MTKEQLVEKALSVLEEIDEIRCELERSKQRLFNERECPLGKRKSHWENSGTIFGDGGSEWECLFCGETFAH